MKSEVKAESKQNSKRAAKWRQRGRKKIPATMGITLLYAESYFLGWSCILLRLISKLLTQDFQTAYVTKSLTMCYIGESGHIVSCGEKGSGMGKG